jgi:hypothetical protein
MATLTPRHPHPPAVNVHITLDTAAFLRAPSASPAQRAQYAAAIVLLSFAGLASAGGTVHIVQRGDNLYSLARDYLENPSQWRELQTLNRVRDPLRLTPGTRLVIPGALMRPQPATAQVLHVAGASTIDHSPAQVGQQVPEGARIEVAEGGFVTLRLADGTVVRLPSGTAVQLRELRYAAPAGHIRSTIELQRGRVDAKVTPLSSPRSRFEVRTPLAVGGVRGTTFGVALDESGAFVNDVQEGAVQVQRLPVHGGRGSAPGALSSTYTLVRAGQGTRVTARRRDAIETTPLLEAPDLSALPAVVEDISLIEFALPALSGAGAWQVRIASDAALEHVERNAVFRQPRARFAGLEDGVYRLAVRAMDERGIPGGESVRAFTVNARPQAPLLREPREGSRVYGPAVELLCTEAGGLVGYRFQIARDARFTDVVAQSAEDATQCAGTFNLTPGDYHWRVAAVARDAQGGQDVGPYSQSIGFSVAAVPPAPARSIIDMKDPDKLTVQWNPGAGGPWRYRLQIARDAMFTDLLEDLQLPAPVHQRPTPSAGTYHLRVRQLDDFGMEGPWSPVQTLEVPGRIVTSDQRPLMNSEGQHVHPGAR